MTKEEAALLATNFDNVSRVRRLAVQTWLHEPHAWDCHGECKCHRAEARRAILATGGLFRIWPETPNLQSRVECALHERAEVFKITPPPSLGITYEPSGPAYYCPECATERKGLTS